MAVTLEDFEAAFARYREGGVARAAALGNRGPARFGDDGKLVPEIMDAYLEHGFYVFEGVVDAAEVEELRADVQHVLDRAPVAQDSDVDAQGQPALGLEFERPTYSFIKPLSDPWGGTALLNGRHPTRMSEPTPDDSAPNAVPFLLSGMCQTMPSGLRLYGHPALLGIAASINGDDFVPYNDATFVKLAGVGGSVSWHQDGVTHWDHPNWDSGIHGFNFQVQLYGCTAANGLWVVPGTHKAGRIDIKAQVAANGGDERLPDAVPLVCEPGDVTVVNRQMLHGSFANTSVDPRISLTFGFHRRSSVLGARGALSQTADEVYDEARIFARSAVIQVAIDARAQHRPDEAPFAYQPFEGLADEYRHTEANWLKHIKNYNLLDLSI